MAQRIVAHCRACGNPYAARLTGEGEILIPTDDGTCNCGSDDMALTDDVGDTEADAERSEWE